MTQAYFGAFSTGNKAAIQVMVDFFGGPGTFAAWPEAVSEYAVRTTATNILDWETARSFALPPAVLARVAVSTLILRGGVSPPAMQRMNELLSDNMRDASLATVAGAAHFLIATHPDQVAHLVAGHVAGTELAPPRREDQRASRPSFG